MKRSEIMEPGMAALQDTLDAIARETPPVPESFRSAWRKAVRQEAAGQKERENITLEKAQPEAPRPEKDMTVSSGTRQARRKGNITWQRGLSIAAAFVLLLGGALIGWDTVSLVRQEAKTSGILDSMEDAGDEVMEFSANEAVGMAMKAETDGSTETAMEAETNEDSEEAVEAVENEAVLMAMGAEPSETMKPPLEVKANEALMMAKGTVASEAMEEAIEAEADETMDAALGAEVDEVMDAALESEADKAVGTGAEDGAEEDMGAEPEENASATTARPARTVGFILVGLAFTLAVGALIFRKRERH